jgi:hypothetical protein
MVPLFGIILQVSALKLHIKDSWGISCLFTAPLWHDIAVVFGDSTCNNETFSYKLAQENDVTD